MNGPPDRDSLTPQQKRELLAKLLQENKAPSIHAISYGQRALWHVQRLMPESPVYNVTVAWLVRSELDIPALRQTFQWLVDRHAALRTTYELRGEEPVQIVHPRRKLAFMLHQTSDLSDTELDRELARASHRPFDLEKGPLLRIDLYLREPGRHILLVCFHHIAVDLWSSTYLFDEVGRLYPAACKGSRPQPPPARLNFDDYVRWQRELLEGPKGDRLWNYWKQQFPRRLPPFRLPIQRKPEIRQCYAGALHPFRLEHRLTQSLRTLARKYRTTLYVLLLAGFEVLLHRYSRQEEFLLRSLTVGRSRAQFEWVIGFFANPVVIRADIGGDPSFHQMIERVREAVSQTIEHQDYPFELVMERLRFGRDINYNPNPEVMFILQTPQRFVSVRGENSQVGPRGIFAPGPTGIRLDLGGLVVEKYNPVQRVALNELAVEMAEVGNVLSGAVHYRTDIYAARDIARLAVHYREIMTAMAANPARRISEFEPAGGFPELPPPSPVGLAAPDAAASRPGTPVPPRDPVESRLADIWKTVLRKRTVGIFDDFFRLGGSSLQALQLITHVRESFQVDLPLRRLFEVRTIEGLAGLLRERRIRSPAPAIEPAGREERMPLSFAQERLWFLDRLAEGRAFFNIPIAVRLKGPLDPAILERALNSIIRRHEILRTAFLTENGRPWQSILPSRPIRLKIEDLGGRPRSRRLAEARQAAAAEAQTPFDLSDDPLLRARLLRLDDEDHVAVLTMHHIVADGWSFGVLFRELSQGYTAHLRGEADPSPEPPIQYADYALWQRKWLRGKVLESRTAYWGRRLKDLPLMDLPSDRPRPPVQTFQGAHRSFRLSSSLTRRLRKLAEEEGATLYMVLLAAFLTMLLRYTGQDDLAVGSPVAGRDRTEIEGLIGCFINVLVLRCDLSGNPGFRQLLEQVRETALEAYAHQDLPFEELVKTLHLKRDLSRQPLISVMFALQNLTLPRLHIPGGPDLSVLDIERGVAQYDLTLFAAEAGGGLSGRMEYNTSLFEAGTIDRMAAQYRNLLEGIAADSKGRLWELPLLGEEERQSLLSPDQASGGEDRETTVLDLFEAQARLTPEAAAVYDAGRRLTYRELEGEADQVAQLLAAHGAGPGDLIAINLERSAGLVAALLGCWKRGAAWIPLDPAQPERRTRLILKEAGAALVLTSRARRGDPAGPEYDLTPLRPRDKGSPPAGRLNSRKRAVVRPGDTAYVIFTSGTSGIPKGVVTSHRATANYLTWCREAYSLGIGGRIPLHSSPAYDFTITSLFAALVSGGCVVVVPSNSGGDVTAGLENDAEGWDLLKLTPQHARRLGEILGSSLPRTRTLVIGGEEVLAEHIAPWRRYAPETVIFNEYGPTEATVGCVAYRLPDKAAPGRRIPIGRPIPHTRAYILDGFLNPAPIGVPGDLYVAGRCLAEGYLHRPDLTAEHFPPDPFQPDKEARMYRTGDRARRLPSGEIEFMGRRDDQIKMRGYRIEPGEIEAALQDHPNVRRAVVMVRGRSGSDRYLAAYVETGPHAQPDKTELKRFLRERLPEYMIPRRLVFLDTIPLSPAGKTDRQALPEPPPEPPRAGGIAPRNPLERELAAIWREVLGLDQIGVHEDFFERGGHSLSALRVVSEIRTRLGRELPLRTVFEAPTIAQLAARFEPRRIGPPGGYGDDPQEPGWLRLRAGDQGPPLFCLHPAGGGVEIYRDLVRSLEPGTEVLGIRSRALLSPSPEYDSLKEMGRAYADLIRRTQTTGPHCLLGWSFGGAAAHATAAALEADGGEVGFLGLIDTRLPTGANIQPPGGILEYVHGLLKTVGGGTAPDPAALFPSGFFKKIADLPPGEARARVIGHLEKTRGRESGIPRDMMLSILRLIDAHERLLAMYRPRPIQAPIFFWHARDGWPSGTAQTGPAGLTRGEATGMTLPGGHYSLLSPPHVGRLASSLSSILKRRRGVGRSPVEDHEDQSR